MRRAREGGGSAWTARAPLVRFLTRERQKKKKKKRRTAEEERTGVRGISRPARFREAAVRGGRAAARCRRSGGARNSRPGIRRAYPNISSFLIPERERCYHIERIGLEEQPDGMD